jgi:UMF1 family MFS transporter
VAVTVPRPIPARAVASWILYDLANTIFTMGVVSLYFSLLVRDEVGATRADTVYGLVSAVSMGLIFVISPLLGAMTDRARRRMPFLVGSTLLCCAATAMIARGPFALSVFLFIVANAAYQAGLQFYDALLPEVSTDANRGRISGLGIGFGYLGSYLAVGLGFFIPSDERAWLFTIIAFSFFVLAVPCFLFVGERGNPHPRPVLGWAVVRDSTAETWHTLRSGHEYPGLVRFLVGRVFYMDAINTVIAYMSLYTVNVAMATGLSAEAGEGQARLILLSAITCAVVGGLIWGVVADRIGPKRTLNAVLWLWIGVFALAAAVGGFRLHIGGLYVVAALAGIGLGGVQAADRPLMLRLAPAHRIGEFYGLYGMVSRFSAVSGPLVWSAVTYVTVTRGGAPPLQGQALAILCLLAMTVIGFAIVRPVSDEKTPGVIGARNVLR